MCKNCPECGTKTKSTMFKDTQRPDETMWIIYCPKCEWEYENKFVKIA